jgi:hypothetical protein
MKKKITLADIVTRLDRGEIIPISESDWIGLAPSFPARDIIATGLAGEILLVKRPLPGTGSKQKWAIVEEPPKTRERVIRPFASESEARALIADRLAAYERMWDG